ncbi:MAG: sensor domain-containing diguanylate cyclase [Candidatus Omnitrophica bacterium]|nr:sensor domain-containing diguanylate cyclase [Candidatus Omnitrophota bacterium]
MDENIKYLQEQAKKLKEEAEKIRYQLYIFYELTKAMRTTLRLEEIVYIILTGLTAHQGLAFNRAILFLVDEENKKINGFMGIGPMDSQEANAIWRSIEQQKMDLYDLIKTYNRIKEEKLKPKFMEFIQSLSFPLSEESGFIYDVLWERGTLHIKENKINEYENDPLSSQLQLKEFLISSVWIKDKPSGLIIVDNSITRKPITDEDIRIFNMFVEQASGAIENSQAFEDTLIKSHTDPLTSLWNHGYFQYKLDEELMKAKAKNYPLSILMLDLDDFKKFNDTYGHMQGDEALRTISETLKENEKTQSVICRYGGEEFSVILPATNREDALTYAEGIRKKVSEKEIFGNRFTVSIGLSNYPNDGLDKDTLIKKADVALYRAKREGKNKIVLAF